MILICVIGRPGRFSAGFKFECSGSTGAVLMLPEGGFRKDLLAKKLFHEYAMRNAAAWYQFAGSPDLGRETENVSLYLVTGCDKSRAWGIASYDRPSGGAEISSKFMTVGVGEDGASPVYSWEDYSPATVRISCQDRSISNEARRHSSVHDSNPSPTFNQCIFIRGFRISLETRYMHWLLGEKVKIEEGINPKTTLEGGTHSSLLLSTADSSSSQAVIYGGSSSYGRQNSDQRMDVINEHDILLQNISSVSSVSTNVYFSRH